MPRPAAKAASKPEFSIRPATEADLPVLAEQRNSMYGSMAPDSDLDFKAYKRIYIDWAGKEMRRKKLVSFVVTDRKGEPVASGSVWVRDNHPSPRYPGTELPYLMSMFTDPAHRRKGLATMIVKEAIAWSRKHRFPRLILHASAMGESVYAKLGFERTTEMRLVLDPRGRSLSKPSRK